MAKEIERKFLIKNENWKTLVKSQIQIKQGYLNDDPNRAVRIRIKDQKGIITIKGKTTGFSRLEFEYEIPYPDALALLKLCNQPIIEKTRYHVFENDLLWEIDIFEGDNKGLQIVEVELDAEDQKVQTPEWVGQEVTDDSKYYNLSLMTFPYTQWKK